MHYKILNKVGADKVVFPEKESGTRLAKFIKFWASWYHWIKSKCIYDWNRCKKEWISKTLIELNLRKKYSLVIAIKDGNNIDINVDPTLPLHPKMKLIVVGNKNKVVKVKIIYNRKLC